MSYINVKSINLASLVAFVIFFNIKGAEILMNWSALIFAVTISIIIANWLAPNNTKIKHAINKFFD